MESTNTIRSPMEMKKKMHVLAKRYGRQHSGLSSDKLLIKLHSAALVIQLFYRKVLLRNGFYKSQKFSDVKDSESDMYIDSEVEEMKEEGIANGSVRGELPNQDRSMH